MRQDGSSNYWKIGVGSHEIVRELAYEVQKLVKTCPVYLHRRVNTVQTDAVLVVIHVRRILKKPWRSVDSDRYHSVVLSCRMIDSSRISLVLGAELAFGII